MKSIIILLFVFSLNISLAQPWKPYGAGFTNNGVFDFINYNGELFASGSFYSTTSSIDNIARWDGINWNPLGPGMLGGVYCMTIFNGNLYAGGGFSTITGVPYARKVAWWDGTNWHSLASGIQWGTVNTMAVYQGNLYVGGNIVTVDSTPMRDISKWDGTSWSLPCTINAGLSELFSMAVFNNELYIGGYFGSINGIPTANIAKFDGTTWSDVGGGLNSDVFVLFPDTVNNRLYAGGNFNYSGGGTVSCPSNVAYWDGTNWNAVGVNGPDLHPTALGVYKDELYIGNNVASKINQSGDTLNGIARWNGIDWQPLDKGINGSVHALLVFNNELAVGGGFTQAGDTAANEVAAWEYTPNTIHEINNYKEKIKIIPNPFKNTATFKLPLSFKNKLPYTFKLFDVTDKEVLEIKNISSLNFIVSKAALNKGIYFYKLLSKDKEIAAGKIVISE